MAIIIGEVAHEKMQIFLSDEAYNNLTADARVYDFIRQNANSGLSLYMTNLLKANNSLADWKDTRPEFIKSHDLDELLNDRYPIWDDGSPKARRLLSLSPTIEPQLVNALGIVRLHPWHGHPLMKPASLTSQFWEVVGIRWLTPSRVPILPQWKDKVRNKRFEINF